MRRLLLPAAAAALAALAVTGCSSTAGHAGHDSTARPMPSASGTAVYRLTDAEAAFLTGMIPHHQQALEMTALAQARTTNPAVLDLAGRIAAAQEPEIAQMTALLLADGRPTPGEHAVHTGAGHDGMLTLAQMADLEQATGPAFDAAFLTGMIAHHQGAIEMAGPLTQTADPEIAALARSMVADQNDEIAEMRSLLAPGGAA